MTFDDWWLDFEYPAHTNLPKGIAKAAWLAAMEEAAKVCEDAWKEKLIGADRASWNTAVNSCAAAIREMC